MTEEDRERVLAIEKLRALIEEGVGKKCLMSQFELEAEEQKRALGQRVLDEKIATLEPENGRPKPCLFCGKSSKRRAAAVERTFRSMSGEHTFHRDYYYCERCSKGFYPRDAFLGLPEHGAETIELERRLADFAINDTYDVASERWNFHYPLKTSANQFRQVIKRLGAKLEAAAENPTLMHAAMKPPDAKATETLYVMNDGGMVPMRGEWRECKLAVVFRDDGHVKGDANLRGKIDDARYVAVLGEQAEFQPELQQALFVEEAMKARRVVWVADGAKGNWNLASVLAPNATQILDWHHAIQHATDCCKALYGESANDCFDLWKETIERLLLKDVGEVLTQLKECLQHEASTSHQRHALEELIGYYETNLHRMKYGQYIRDGLLIGSGPVESAHRHVIQARMKRSGQHWGNHGGQQMARLRAVYRTTGAERFYDAIHWAGRYGPKTEKLSLFEKRRASNR